MARNCGGPDSPEDPELVAKDEDLETLGAMVGKWATKRRENPRMIRLRRNNIGG